MNNTKNTVKAFDQFADEYQHKFMDVKLYQEGLDKFCQLLEKDKSEVLDLACGPGNISKYILGKRPELQILGTDLSESMLKLAKVNNPDAVFQLLDCRDLLKLNQTFDAIICGFGLPYLSKAEAINFIRDASSGLNSGGILYLSTMEDNYSKSGYKQSSSGEYPALFIHYHQEDYLTTALQDNGFELLYSIKTDIPGEPDSSTKDLVLIAKRHL